MSKTKIKSISMLPVDGLFRVYEDHDEELYKSPVLAIACVHVHNEEEGHSINFIPVETADIAEGFLLLDDEGQEINEVTNFKGYLNSKSEAVKLTPDEIAKLITPDARQE